MTERISVVGLGRLGLCLAACFADCGFEVLGVDIDEKIVSDVSRGKAPWFEQGLEQLLSKYGGRNLRATLNHKEAIDKTDISFVLVPTPSNKDGDFSNMYVESALDSLAAGLADSRKDSHLFVISSTVMPGSTYSTFIPILEKISRRKLNKGFEVCYDPDFVALGNVLEGFTKPDLVVIGESTSRAGNQIKAIHNELCRNKPVISRMSIINAEVAKVCLNAYITLKISYANSIANICEQIPGADVDDITKAIGADRRISPYYFKGGLSYGGTCFPRDARAFSALAEKYDVQAELVKATTAVNEYQDARLADLVLRERNLLENKTIGVLGLAFTDKTPVVTESSAVKLISKLLKYNINIVAYDSLAIENTRTIFGNAIEYVDSVESCLRKSGLVVIALRNQDFKESVEGYMVESPLVIIDGWRIIDSTKIDKRIRYVPIGRFRSDFDQSTRLPVTLIEAECNSQITRSP